MKLRPVLLVLVLGAASGCAGSPGGSTLQLSDAQPTSGTSAGASPGYSLSEEEKALNCKQLTGRMQVRLLQVRDYVARQKTSSLSRTMQNASNSVLGGSAFGANPDAQHQRDRAQLAAYNKRLAEQNCATFNLAEEFKPKDVTHTPTPQKKSGTKKSR